MNILTVDNITKSYGVRKIFDGASFFLQEGEKAGIIGINGTGKSTLLKMIAGLEEADDGTVIKANHCLVRYLPQNPEFAPEETVLEAVLRDALFDAFEEVLGLVLWRRLGILADGTVNGLRPDCSHGAGTGQSGDYRGQGARATALRWRPA